MPLPPALPGDYNQNGVVDAADYVLWRDSLGQIGPLLAADHTGPDGIPDGIVDQLDYDLWRANFGNIIVLSSSLPRATEPLASVPEPSSLPLLLVAAVAPFGIIARRAPILDKRAPFVKEFGYA